MRRSFVLFAVLSGLLVGAPPALAGKLKFTDCGDGFQCATAMVQPAHDQFVFCN